MAYLLYGKMANIIPEKMKITRTPQSMPERQFVAWQANINSLSITSTGGEIPFCLKSKSSQG
jgi:hypothetical protein